jgi:hypothetical protein
VIRRTADGKPMPETEMLEFLMNEFKASYKRGRG